MVRSRVLVVAFAASAAFTLLLASTVAVADGDSDSDGVPDAIESETQRNVVAVAAGDEFDISSRLVNAPAADQFDLTYKAGTFDVWYERAGGGTTGFELEMRNIVEWIDANGNDRLDSGEVRAPFPVAFGNAQVNHTTVLNADGGRVNFLNVTSNDGQITLNLTVAQRFMRLSAERVLTPMEVKMDITIDHGRQLADANLGIEMRVDTENRVEYNNRSWDEDNHFATSPSGEASMNVTGGPAGRAATAFFSWSKKALADGREIPVDVSSWKDPEPNTYDLYLAYRVDSVVPRVRIVHDPTFGVESAAYEDVIHRVPPLQGDTILYGVSLAAIAVLVLGTFILANRRTKKREE